MRPNLLANNERTFKNLGVDVISFTPNWKVVKRLMREALVRKGDFWHCHTRFSPTPCIGHQVQCALGVRGNYNEYTSYYDYRNDEQTVDETSYNRFVNLGITADTGMIENDFDLDPRDYSHTPIRHCAT